MSRLRRNFQELVTKQITSERPFSLGSSTVRHKSSALCVATPGEVFMNTSSAVLVHKNWFQIYRSSCDQRQIHDTFYIRQTTVILLVKICHYKCQIAAPFFTTPPRSGETETEPLRLYMCLRCVMSDLTNSASCIASAVFSCSLILLRHVLRIIIAGILIIGVHDSALQTRLLVIQPVALHKCALCSTPALVYMPDLGAHLESIRLRRFQKGSCPACC